MLDSNVIDQAAPMPAAPMKYKEDGSVDWGNMWDSFCVLAKAGGPPHRGEMLRRPEVVDAAAVGYETAVAEIVRGIFEVSGLQAAVAKEGWIRVQCPEQGQAGWLAEAICTENVEAYAEGDGLFVPVADSYTLKGEIKSVITAVAKTTHYWEEHLPLEVKRALALQAKLAQLKQTLFGWFQRH